MAATVSQCDMDKHPKTRTNTRSSTQELVEWVLFRGASAPPDASLKAAKDQHLAAFFHVRPAWAHSYGCKSRRKLITTSEVKRNCMRAAECGNASVEHKL